jgi:hypothetical protein
VASICTSAFKSGAVPPCGAASSIILEEGHCPSRGVHGFFRAVRVSLSGAVNSSGFQEVSLGREVSIVFTSNGPLIYRWEANNGEQRETAGRLSLSIKLGGASGHFESCKKGSAQDGLLPEQLRIPVARPQRAAG